MYFSFFSLFTGSRKKISLYFLASAPVLLGLCTCAFCPSRVHVCAFRPLFLAFGPLLLGLCAFCLVLGSSASLSELERFGFGSGALSNSVWVSAVVRTHSRIQTPAELVEQSRPTWPQAVNAVLGVIVWWVELLPSRQARRKMEGPKACFSAVPAFASRCFSLRLFFFELRAFAAWPFAKTFRVKT